MYTAYSKCIQKEIDGSKFYITKKILGVDYMSQVKTADVVTTNADKVMKWREENVIDGIWELYQKIAYMSDKSEVMELYKLHAKFANDVTAWRQKTNAFYISLFTIIISSDSFFRINEKYSIALPCIVCGIISILWFLQIRSFRILNSPKFHAFDEMEDCFAIKPFEMEWTMAEKLNYARFTIIEQLITIVFLALFLGILINHYDIWKIISSYFCSCSKDLSIKH
jgi:hypothetical protein